MIKITKEWCEAMAKLEDGGEIGAGPLDHPLRAFPPLDVSLSQLQDRPVAPAKATRAARTLKPHK